MFDKTSPRFSIHCTWFWWWCCSFHTIPIVLLCDRHTESGRTMAVFPRRISFSVFYFIQFVCTFVSLVVYQRECAAAAVVVFFSLFCSQSVYFIWLWKSHCLFCYWSCIHEVTLKYTMWFSITFFSISLSISFFCFSLLSLCPNQWQCVAVFFHNRCSRALTNKICSLLVA